MLRASPPRRAPRIPSIKGFQSHARVKWATYTFWYAVDPVLRRHFAYYRRKVLFDRFLERNSILTNSAIGVVVGVTVYFIVIRGFLVPPSEGAKEHTMKENASEVFELMRADTSKDLPAFQLMRIKREILGKLHDVADIAEVRRQRNEVEEFKRLLGDLDALPQAPTSTA